MVEKTHYETVDYYVLPEKYHFDHDYCIYLYDQLTKIMSQGEKLGVFGQNIKIKKKLPKLKGEDLFNWLRKNGFSRQAKHFMVKNVFAATLSDALQFFSTALQCSFKGKLSVTYATLRKPLKDNLFILELLNVNKKDFFKRFKNPSELLEIRGFSPQDKKEIINRNCEKIKFSANFNDIIYDLRYSKSAKGFEPLFQKASHITTKVKHFQTEEENLNFIFSNDESLDSQWRKLYRVLPFLLRYFVDTSYHILNNNITKRIKDELNFIDILYYSRHYPRFIEGMPFKLYCKKCKKSNKANKKTLDLCEKNGMYTCPCGEQESILNVEMLKVESAQSKA